MFWQNSRIAKLKFHLILIEISKYSVCFWISIKETDFKGSAVNYLEKIDFDETYRLYVKIYAGFENKHENR